MSTLTVRIPEELKAAIAKFCQEEDRSKSWLIKRALQEKLEDWQDLRDGLKYSAPQFSDHPTQFLIRLFS